jgi:hypothetical protein
MVIFLDFDGATHPDRCFADNLFCRMPLIEEVLHEFPRVKIVISSSWRERYSLDDMRGFFDAGMQDRVIDVTHNIDSFVGCWCRRDFDPGCRETLTHGRPPQTLAQYGPPLVDPRSAEIGMVGQFDVGGNTLVGLKGPIHAGFKPLGWPLMGRYLSFYGE